MVGATQFKIFYNRQKEMGQYNPPREEQAAREQIEALLEKFPRAARIRANIPTPYTYRTDLATALTERSGPLPRDLVPTAWEDITGDQENLNCFRQLSGFARQKNLTQAMLGTPTNFQELLADLQTQIASRQLAAEPPGRHSSPNVPASQAGQFQDSEGVYTLANSTGGGGTGMRKRKTFPPSKPRLIINTLH